MKRLLIAIIGILILPVITNAQVPEERILSYHSDIEVLADASVVVKETIQVFSTGDQIRRGIYRDFPIAYKDRSGHRYLVGFDLVEVKRDGSPEPYHIQRSGNGLRIYVGEEDVFIPLGEHQYELTYKTDRQIGFFQDHDELYWNVTGNGWVFPIESATAQVNLPGNLSKDQIKATLYTGPEGSTAQDGVWTINDQGVINFATTLPLASYEGLTIVVGWPKGIVVAPTAAENFWATVRGNLDYIIGGIGFLIVLAYYFYVWNKRGRDPKKSTIVAQYESPQGLSPALLRFVSRMGSDDRAFAAAIINMGVKGALSVTEEKGFLKKTKFTLSKKTGKLKSDLSAEEQILLDKFFADGDSIKLETKNATKISKIKGEFVDSLKVQAGKKYFSKNGWAVVIGLVLSVLVLAATIIAASSIRYGVDSFLEILFWPALILVLVATNITFGWLLRAFTVEGRKLVDEIEGFKLFLSVTEKDRLAFHNPPEPTPELFEKMLPYALALDVEHKWAQQFASVFDRLKEQGVNYAPVWYYGSIANFSPESLASSMESTFVGVVSSSSTPPGSSSGFSGGGSGGGGGGGGGGGW